MKLTALIMGAIALVTSSLVLADGHVNLDGPGSLPANPEVGQCYVHKFFPPEYTATETEVLVKEAYKYYTKTPAVIGTTQIFHTFKKPDLVQIVDPEFETERVRIMIKPDDPVWHVKCCKDKKKGCRNPCPYPKGDHNHDLDMGDVLKSKHAKHNCGTCGPKKKGPCEQACFKQPRPVYKTYVKQRAKVDGSYIQQVQAAEIFTFNVPVVEEPPTVTEHIVPAEYMTFKVYTLDHPGYMEWVEGTCKRFVCDIRELQHALAKKGYFKGAKDGILGPITLKALNEFRADKGLGIHDEVDKETADALGLKK